MKMDPLMSMIMNSTETPTCTRRDLENLLTILDTAEEVATSSPSDYLGSFNDHCPGAFSFLEPTPIRPDREIAIRQQHFLVKHQSQSQQVTPKITYPFPISGGLPLWDLISGSDNEPVDLEDTTVTPVVSRNMMKELPGSSKTTSNNGTLVMPSLAQSKLTFPSEDQARFPDVNKMHTFPASWVNSDSTSHVRFRMYQTCQWDQRFQELLLFRQEHGHLLVPHSYPPNQKLAQWVKRQRHQCKRKKMGHHSTLTDDREAHLLEVGFIFDSHRAVWHARFEALRTYKLSNGHCSIPAKFDDGALNVWIKHQRRQYLLFKKGRKSTMTDERIAMLDSIGFDWNPRNLVRPCKI
jgi:hypothetical protein